MKITYENKVDDYTLTSSEELTGYVSSNVQDPHLSKQWLCNSTSGWILLDSTSGIAPECVFVAGTNLTDTATVKIQGNDTDEWTSPAVDLELSKINDIYYTWNILDEYRYWRLSVEDLNVEDEQIFIGRWWLGDQKEINGPSNVFTEKYVDTSEIFISKSGQAYGNERYCYYAYDMTYGIMTNDEKIIVKDFKDYCKGGKSFFTSFSDRDDKRLGPFYMIDTGSGGDFVHLRTLDLWSIMLSFQQTF